MFDSMLFNPQFHAPAHNDVRVKLIMAMHFECHWNASEDKIGDFVMVASLVQHRSF